MFQLSAKNKQGLTSSMPVLIVRTHEDGASIDGKEEKRLNGSEGRSKWKRRMDVLSQK